MSPARRRQIVDREQPKLPMVRQCAPRFRGAGTAGGDPFQRLLWCQGGLGRGPVPDGRDRPSVPGDPFLRVQPDEGLARAAGRAGNQRANAEADEGQGAAGYLPSAPQPADRRRHILAGLSS